MYTHTHTYTNPIESPQKNLEKNVRVKNLGKNVHLSRPSDINYPDTGHLEHYNLEPIQRLRMQD